VKIAKLDSKCAKNIDIRKFYFKYNDINGLLLSLIVLL